MKRASRLLLTAAITGVVCASSPAFAGDFAPWFGASRAGGFVDVWPAEDLTAVMFGAELQLRVARSVFLDISINGAAAQARGFNGDDVAFAYGNPTFGAHYAGQATRNLSFYVGGTFTPPLLHEPEGDVLGAALLTMQIRGLWDLDRFLPNQAAVRAMAGMEWNFVDPLYLRVDLRPVVIIPTRNGIGIDGGRDAELLIEHAVEFEGRTRSGIGGGVRLQAVLLPTVSGDQAQVVFEPFFAITPRTRGFYMKLGLPLALDESLGPGFDRNKLAAGRIALGGQW